MTAAAHVIAANFLREGAASPTIEIPPLPRSQGQRVQLASVQFLHSVCKDLNTSKCQLDPMSHNPFQSNWKFDFHLPKVSIYFNFANVSSAL